MPPAIFPRNISHVLLVWLVFQSVNCSVRSMLNHNFMIFVPYFLENSPRLINSAVPYLCSIDDWQKKTIWHFFCFEFLVQLCLGGDENSIVSIMYGFDDYCRLTIVKNVEEMKWKGYRTSWSSLINQSNQTSLIQKQPFRISTFANFYQVILLRLRTWALQDIEKIAVKQNQNFLTGQGKLRWGCCNRVRMLSFGSLAGILERLSGSFVLSSSHTFYRLKCVWPKNSVQFKHHLFLFSDIRNFSVKLPTYSPILKKYIFQKVSKLFCCVSILPS